MKDTEHDGTLLAIEPASKASTKSTPVTVDDLLRLFPKRSGAGREGASIHSAANNFLGFIGTAAQETQIHLLETRLDSWVQQLEAAGYRYETVKSYRYCLNLLVKSAREHGWEPPLAIVPPSWTQVIALTTRKELKSIVRFAVVSGKTPSTFDEGDLRRWCQERVQAGRTLGGSKTNCSLFRSLMAKPELAHLGPLLKLQLEGYGLRLQLMHPGLRCEVEELIAYRTEEFHLDRNGPPIRPATAEILLRSFEGLTGFMQNVEGCSPIESLADLLTKKNVTKFIQWALKVRKLQGNGPVRMLSSINASLKDHPVHSTLDLTWIPAIIKKMTCATRDEIDRRKEHKYITFADADDIPKKIRAARNRAKKLNAPEIAESFRDEMIMLWLVNLPWRQLNLRECRLTGGTHPNVYLAPIRPNSQATRSVRTARQEKLNPRKPFWQVYFSKDETKGKREAKGFLPDLLVVQLEEYLVHRAALIPEGKPDPGTLFLTKSGKAMRAAEFRNLIKELTSLHSGVAVNPHLFRDIVAYNWLQNKPHDYATLSRLLWHRDLAYTMKVYGSRFDESTAMARMDDWRNGDD